MNSLTLAIFLVAARILALSAAFPVTPPESRTARPARRLLPQLDDGQIDHRQLLRERHKQISSGDAATAFVHPTHLYRRDADVLPPPDKAYDLNVTQGIISPDGFERLGFLMNGKFPADPFVWDENDDVEITVNNESPVPFAIHWHGIHQIGTPEMDGVPGLSQWNIYTGESYTYRFKLINQHGGYWYHSHERGYYADGIRGTIYIRPKPDRLKPWSLISQDQNDIDQMEAAENDFRVMSLSDHWHINHTEMLLVVHETGVPPACFDSLHINGRGRQYCVDDWTKVWSPIQAGLLKNFSSTNPEGLTSKGCISLVPPKPGFTVKGTLDGRYGGVCQNTTAPLTVFSAAKAIKEGRRWLNLQVIDGASNWYYGVSIDSHKMYIVAVDGHYIHPMRVDWAQITIGSRLSVMIELDPDLDGNIFPIRLTGARALQAIEGHAFLSYIDEVDGTWNPELEEDFGYAMRTLTDAHVPMSGFITDTSVVKWQQNLSLPFDPIRRVPQTSNMTLHAVASQNSLNVWQLATMPLDTAHLADERPMLFNATDGSLTSNQMNPYATMPFGTVVDIIMENNIYSIVGGPNSPHPFHMHSRRFWIIGSGVGPFPADTVAEAQELGVVFNLDNPPLRDGFDIDSNSWVVIRYVVDHAAANILHCHIDDHAIEGMAAVLLEGLETIPAGGNFSETIKARPANFFETQTDQLGQVLEASWATGSVNSKYSAPAPTDTVTPWGDPRELANSVQLLASSNSVQKSITSSLQKQLSAVQATATYEVTAITAIVSDYLTTFMAVAASTTAVGSVATAITSAGVATVASAADPTDTQQSTLIAAATTLVDPAQSTLIAAASTPTGGANAIPIGTAVALSTAAVSSAAVAATGTAAAPLDTDQSTLVAAGSTPTNVASASQIQTPGADSSVAAPQTAIAPSIVTVTVVSSAQETQVASLATTKAATAPALGTLSLGSITPSFGQQTGTSANAALATVSIVAYSTLYRTSSAIVFVSASATAGAVSATETGPDAAKQTSLAATLAASISVPGSTTRYMTASRTNSGLVTAVLSQTAVAATAIPTSTTHLYSSFETQQVLSSAVSSLDLAASTVLPVMTASSLNPADYGTNSATVTFFADTTTLAGQPVEATPTPAPTDDAIDDEPAYDNPVFPSTAGLDTAATSDVTDGDGVNDDAGDASARLEGGGGDESGGDTESEDGMTSDPYMAD